MVVFEKLKFFFIRRDVSKRVETQSECQTRQQTSDHGGEQSITSWSIVWWCWLYPPSASPAERKIPSAAKTANAHRPR